MKVKNSTKNVQNSSGFVIPRPMSNRVALLVGRFRSRSAHTITIILLIVAITGAALIYLLYQNMQQNRDDAFVIGSETTKLIQESETLAGKGQYQDAVELIDDRIKVAENDLEKATLKTTQAQHLLNSGNPDKAIALAKDANKIQESAVTHALIGYAAEQKKDWQLAADSFARAVQLSEPSEDGEISPANDYKNLENEMRKKL